MSKCIGHFTAYANTYKPVANHMISMSS